MKQKERPKKTEVPSSLQPLDVRPLSKKTPFYFSGGFRGLTSLRPFSLTFLTPPPTLSSPYRSPSKPTLKTALSVEDLNFPVQAFSVTRILSKKLFQPHVTSDVCVRLGSLFQVGSYGHHYKGDVRTDPHLERV